MTDFLLGYLFPAVQFWHWKLLESEGQIDREAMGIVDLVGNTPNTGL